MQEFAALYEALDSTTSTNAKVAAMVDYFRAAPPADAAWAVYFLTGRRLKRLIGGSVLWGWGRELSDLPEWLFEDCHAAVGDLAEVVALVLDDPERGAASDLPLSRWVEERLLPLREVGEADQRAAVQAWWRDLDRPQTFLLNKLLTGALRVGVSQTLVARALAEAADLPRPVIEHRLMGNWEPTAAFFEKLLAAETDDADRSRPYPFYLASPLEGDPSALGDVGEWLAEWKWDGIRSQLVRRDGQVYLWSRGEELIGERFPEIAQAAARLPDGCVIDGEVMAWRQGAPLPFAELQRRIGRKTLTAKVLSEAPAALVAYDLLELGGEDIRAWPIERRRAELEALLGNLGEPFVVSPLVAAASWEALAELRGESRQRRVEGLMLKHRHSPYRVGRKRGEWWKWKIDPYSIDAVLIYGQMGHGRRASLFTDYTFAVWQGEELVPIAKAYSGLTDAEIREIDTWIRRHTKDRFGPVRSVEPRHVFELHFEGLAESPRHKSGIAVRFPRIARWRRDKLPADANTLDDVRALLNAARE